MKSLQKKYGIFGGAFNPPHIAHSIIAKDILERLKLDKIIFIPSGNPPLKHRDVISAEHRYNMAKLAFGRDKDFLLSNIEAKNPDVKSYTVDTLLNLKKIYKNKKIKLYLIIGMDNLINFSRWHQPEKLFSLAEIVVLNRPGYPVDKLKPEFLQNVILIGNPLLEISSSMLREYMRKGKSIKYFVNPDVEKYIIRNKLYLK